jgi:23S rRNA (uracil1939-C5)-methyltransferase
MREPLLMDTTYDIRLTALTYGGDALGRLPDGRAVFVPFALPGERVRVRLVEEKRGHARPELVEVLEPAAGRVQPLCPHFTACGGCHYQHMDYPAQMAAKAAILKEQLERIGGLADALVQPAVPSPQPWNYRNHVQFHIAPDGRLGYQAARSNAIIPIRECHLPEDALNILWPQLEVEALPGLERVGLRLGAGEELMLVLESSDPEPLDFTVEEIPLSAVHLGPGGALVLAGSDHIVMEVLGRPFRVSAASFFQVNTAQAAAMVEHLLAELPLTPGTTALDVYCGAGLFSVFLAPRVGRLAGIELSPAACEDFAVNLDEFENVELYEAAAEEVLAGVDFHPEVIVVDPPRAGLGQATLDGLLRQGASHLAYISCDPATLARDAKRLVQGGYRLRQVTPFDLFPQTYHIESISLWERTGRGSAAH